jgi:hypothetical protein
MNMDGKKMVLNFALSLKNIINRRKRGLSRKKIAGYLTMHISLCVERGKTDAAGA